jgi:hypothetical protein
MTRRRATLILIALLVGGPAAAQLPAWEIPQGNLRTAPALSLLAASFPDSAAMQRRILAAAHQAGDSARVLAALERLAALGYAPTQQTMDQLRPHLSGGSASALDARFQANRRALSASRVEASIPAEHRLVEGIAWDSRRQRFFAATVVGRSLLVQDGDTWRPLSGIEGGSLFGLAIDEARNILWVASGRADPTPSPESAFRGLIAVDLESLAVVRRLAVEGEGSPADIALGPDGTVFASDPRSGAIYRAQPEDERLAAMLPAGRFANPQGLVVAPDGLTLYVADYLHGLAAVDLLGGVVSRLPSAAGTMLDGIDGLAWHQGALIAIQNGTSPRRILRLTLGPDERSIGAVQVLERARWDDAEPTLGWVRGNEFLYVADSQWETYGDLGALRPGHVPRATAIRSIALDGAPPPSRPR